MKSNEPKIIEQGDFKLKIVFWYSEWTKETFYSNTLFYKDKAVHTISCAKREIPIKDMIAMWRAKQ